MLWKGLAALALSAMLLAAADSPAPAPEYRDVERQFWSLQKRSQPEVPAFADPSSRAWIKQPLDAFVLQKLQAAGLRPSPEADRLTLIRRLYYDLTGLPPTPSETADFLSDTSPDAYEKIVDRLLSSPRYGERWGQHWLDLVRFAETEGFEYDRTVEGLWRYRDYVIQSFNSDKPYDQFVREQIAGDEIAPEDQTMQIAVGFHRLGAVRRNAGNQEVASSRNEVLTERTDVLGSAFLGLTVGCARCHDHIFDPIRQKDYYRLQAFLARTDENAIVLASQQEQDRWNGQTQKIRGEMKELSKKMEELQGAERAKMAQQLEELEDSLPAPLPAIASIKMNDVPTPINVLNRGNYDHKGDAVGMRALGVLLPDGTKELPLDTPKPKTILANWLTRPEHPLTARVLVNRIWAFRFGKGIVNTPNDFGMNGERPSHPELLDYIANEFVANGWRMKPIHRTIVLSSTYRQASNVPASHTAETKDPGNRLLWKFNRRRLEAEEIRDSMLAVSGKLNDKMGGPSVIIPVDKELVQLLYKPSQWRIADDSAEHNRRSVYLIAKRNLRLPFMEAFDQPPALTSCALRQSSTHPPQALELLNGDTSNRLAKDLAARLEREVGGIPVQQVERAYLLATGRAPTEQEKSLAVEFLKTQSLSEFALAVFNLNAFLYVN